MPTTTISAAEMRIDARLKHLADVEHWDITPRLLARIIREAGRAANLGRPVDNEQPRTPKVRPVVAAPAAPVAPVAAPTPVAPPEDPEPLPEAVQALVADPVGRAVGALIAEGLTNQQIVARLNKPLWLVKRWTGRWFQASGQGDRVDVGPWIVRVGALRDAGADS